MPQRGPAPGNNLTLLGFDFGTHTIGVAAGQTLTGTASPLTELPAKDGQPDWRKLGALLQEWKPDLVVVGLPLNMDGSESELTARARKFANRLHGRFGVQVELMDERLSTVAAREQILERGGSTNFKRHRVDSIAAGYILESWLNSQLP